MLNQCLLRLNSACVYSKVGQEDLGVHNGCRSSPEAFSILFLHRPLWDTSIFNRPTGLREDSLWEEAVKGQKRLPSVFLRAWCLSLISLCSEPASGLQGFLD